MGNTPNFNRLIIVRCLANATGENFGYHQPRASGDRGLSNGAIVLAQVRPRRAAFGRGSPRGRRS